MPLLQSDLALDDSETTLPILAVRIWRLLFPKAGTQASERAPSPMSAFGCGRSVIRKNSKLRVPFLAEMHNTGRSIPQAVQGATDVDSEFLVGLGIGVGLSHRRKAVRFASLGRGMERRSARVAEPATVWS